VSVLLLCLYRPRGRDAPMHRAEVVSAPLLQQVSMIATARRASYVQIIFVITNLLQVASDVCSCHPVFCVGL